MPDIKISTEAVSLAASGATQVADAVSAMKIQEPLMSAGGAAPGSHTAATALDLGQRLIGDIQAMASDIHNFGGQLNQASSNYVGVDAKATAQVTAGR